MSEENEKGVLTSGIIMLQLPAPEYLRFSKSNQLKANFRLRLSHSCDIDGLWGYSG